MSKSLLIMRFLKMVLITNLMVINVASMAKPDLTRQADLQILQREDTGYQILSTKFSQPAPLISQQIATTEKGAMLQSYAKARHYRVWLAIPKSRVELSSSKSPVPSPPASQITQRSGPKVSKVLYLLDGNAVVDDLEPSLLQRSAISAAPALVFIGYQTPYRFDVEARSYDFTPPLLADRTANQAFLQQGRARLNGGAQQFHRLIEGQIKPWVYQQLGGQPEHEALWGHSFAGLFVLYTLMQHPHAYQQYYSADPSLWWHDGEIIDHWYAYQQKNAHARQADKVDLLVPDLPVTATANHNYAAEVKGSHTRPYLQMTFSRSAAPQSVPAAKATDKEAFAKAVCDYLQPRCHYQFFQQTHGELFKTSMLAAIRDYSSYDYDHKKAHH